MQRSPMCSLLCCFFFLSLFVAIPYGSPLAFPDVAVTTDAMNASQPGPENIRCSANKYSSRVDHNICEPVLQQVDLDIQDTPGPQTWGGAHGLHDRFYHVDSCICFFTIRSSERAPQAVFSYALVKRLALTVLNTCSVEAGEKGKGGIVQLARGFWLEIEGIEWLKNIS